MYVLQPDYDQITIRLQPDEDIPLHIRPQPDDSFDRSLRAATTLARGHTHTVSEQDEQHTCWAISLSPRLPGASKALWSTYDTTKRDDAPHTLAARRSVVAVASRGMYLPQSTATAVQSDTCL